MSPGDLAVGFTLLLALFGIASAVRAIASWLQPYPKARPHRAHIHWQDYGLTARHLDDQWACRSVFMDERQERLDKTQRVLGRMVR